MKNKRPNRTRVYGIHPVEEALNAGQDFEKVFLKNNLGGEAAKALIRQLEERYIPVQRVPQVKLDKLAGNPNHQGVVGLVSPIKYEPLEELVMRAFEAGTSPLLLFPVGVTDVRNLGSLARTAECMGVQGLLLPIKHSAQVTPEAMKSAAGALYHLPVCRVPQPGPTIQYLQQSGIRVVATWEAGEQQIAQIDLAGPVCLLVGAEDVGIPQDIRNRCDHQAHIPLLGEVNALNVAVATGMALYEAMRQRSRL